MCHHTAPPQALSWAQAVGLLSPALACKGGWIPGDGSQHTDLRALCSAAHPSCRTHSSLLLGMCSRPGRGSAKAAGSLQHLPCFCVPVAVVTLGQGSGLAWPWLVQRQPRAGQGCSKPSFLSNGCCNLGAPRGSFPSSFPPKNKGQQWREPAQCRGWFLPRLPAGCAWPGGPGRMQGLLTAEMQHLLFIRLPGLLGL